MAAGSAPQTEFRLDFARSLNSRNGVELGQAAGDHAQAKPFAAVWIEVRSECPEQIEFVGRFFKHRPVVLHAVLQSDGDRPSIEVAQGLADMLLRAGMKRRHPDEIDAIPDHGLPKCIQYTAKIAVDGLEFWTESRCQ